MMLEEIMQERRNSFGNPVKGLREVSQMKSNPITKLFELPIMKQFSNI